ncbi:hypothetical protein CLIB1423_26S00672 [[Candida] railenensis]|uniref:WLM domain-containing protein n=1 Tax=[Candida] railenensis TaxID=45579 RepID=A0A9P0QUR6_9ASCO|nr:hypothetical protein CLIB1423_26S00672 [[Candida] railenensis]
MVIEAKSSNKGGGARGGKPRQQPKVNRPSPISSISKIGSLNRFPDKEYANDLLHQVAKLTAPLIHERGFKVGTLCEMYPKSGNLLGLNVNGGQKILLRLRYHSNSRSFLPMGDLIGTFLHELTHNLYGAHDAKFYKYLDELKERYEYLQMRGSSASMNGYVCEEEKLGGSQGGFYVSEREKRIRAVSKVKYIGESKKLGGGGIQKAGNGARSKMSIRELMLEAAERRARDSKWCPSERREKEAEPDDEELDIVPVLDDEISELPGGLRKEFVDIVDLTSEMDETPQEIVVIDASEEGKKLETSEMKPILKRSNSGNKSGESRSVSFGLLPSLEEGEFKAEKRNVHQDHNNGQIYYVTSTSPRSFFQEGEKYPRRKLVADLDFNQIIHYSPKEKNTPYTPPQAKSSKEILDRNENDTTATSNIPHPKAKKGGADNTQKKSKGKLQNDEKDKESDSHSRSVLPSPVVSKPKRGNAKKPESHHKATTKKKPAKRKSAKAEETKSDQPRKVVRSVEFSDLLD